MLLLRGAFERTSSCAEFVAGNRNDGGRPCRRRPNGVNVARAVFGGECLVEEGPVSLGVLKGGEVDTTGRDLSKYMEYDRCKLV